MSKSAVSLGLGLAVMMSTTGCVRLFVEHHEVPDPNSHPGFAGRWETNYGVVDLTQEGRQVVGGWDQVGGRIIGTLSADGRTLRAGWSNLPTYQPPRDAGVVVFVLSDDGQSFEGTWRYGEKGPDEDTSWSGTRLPQTPGESFVPAMRKQIHFILEY